MNGFRVWGFNKRWRRYGCNCVPGIVLGLLMNMVKWYFSEFLCLDYLSSASVPQRALFQFALLCSCVPFNFTNVAEDFTTSHSLWSLSSIRGDGEPPLAQKQHRTVVFPFTLTLLMQLGATVFPYYLFSYLMCSNGIFRTLNKCPVCLHLSTHCFSELHHFFFIDKVWIFLNKKLIPPLLLCYDITLKASGELCLSVPSAEENISVLISRDLSGIKFQCAEYRFLVYKTQIQFTKTLSICTPLFRWLTYSTGLSSYSIVMAREANLF